MSTKAPSRPAYSVSVLPASVDERSGSGISSELRTAVWLAAYLVVCGISLLVLLTRYRRADG